MAAAALLTSSARAAAAAAPCLAPQGAALVIHSFARAGYRPNPQLVWRLLARLRLGDDDDAEDATPSSGRRRVGRVAVSAQTAAMLLLSLGRLGYRPPEGWTRLLLAHTVNLLPSASSEELRNLAMGLALVRHKPEPLWVRFFCECLDARGLLQQPDEGARQAVAAAAASGSGVAGSETDRGQPGSERVLQLGERERRPREGGQRRRGEQQHRRDLLWALQRIGASGCPPDREIKQSIHEFV